MVATLTQALNELIKQLDRYIDGKVDGKIIEDVYTTNIIIHDDFDLLNENIKNIVELIDNEINNLSAVEIKKFRDELLELVK